MLTRFSTSVGLLLAITLSGDVADALTIVDGGPTSRRAACRTALVGLAGAPLTAAARTAGGVPPAAPAPPNFPRRPPGLAVGNAGAGPLCEVFVDFACPYSRKMFAVIAADDFTIKYRERMAFAYHHVLQPWHHQSLWLHESAFAVRLLYPEAELAYWTALFERAPEWYDDKVYALTRAEFYDQIADFAAGVVVGEARARQAGDRGGDRDDDATGGDPHQRTKARLLQYLIPPLQPGGNFPVEARATLGSSPTDDENALFPYTKQVVKFQRKRGVHVTPTCFFNGIEQGQISSAWTQKDWDEFLVRALA